MVWRERIAVLKTRQPSFLIISTCVFVHLFEITTDPVNITVPVPPDTLLLTRPHAEKFDGIGRAVNQISYVGTFFVFILFIAVVDRKGFSVEIEYLADSENCCIHP